MTQFEPQCTVRPPCLRRLRLRVGPIKRLLPDLAQK